MFPRYDWYNLKGQLIWKNVLCAKKKPNIPNAEGDREANSQDHKNCQKWLFWGRVYHIDSMLNFLLKAIPFILVISSEGFKQKQLICNLFVTNLNDICDFECKILKKQVKSICLLSMR